MYLYTDLMKEKSEQKLVENQPLIKDIGRGFKHGKMNLKKEHKESVEASEMMEKLIDAGLAKRIPVYDENNNIKEFFIKSTLDGKILSYENIYGMIKLFERNKISDEGEKSKWEKDETIIDIKKDKKVGWNLGNRVMDTDDTSKDN